MIKNSDKEQQWGLNLKTIENNPININAVLALEFRDIMANALSSDKFASNLMSKKPPEKWHQEENALCYDLKKLYIPDTLGTRDKELSHDIPLAGHCGTAGTIEIEKKTTTSLT